MILNTYAVLLTFVDLLRLLLGLVAMAWVILTWRQQHQSQAPDHRSHLENRLYLVFLITFVLIGLNLISWPLLYLLLQSYVSEWPGVMCIYGVTQIGVDSLGSSRHLPGLLSGLQMMKPFLVFIGGLWFVLYLLHRSTPTGSLQKRLFLILIPFAILLFVDVLMELAYVTIPKKEEFPTGGCCTGKQIQDSLSWSPTSAKEEAGLSLWYFGGNIAILVAILFSSRGLRSSPTGGSLIGLLLANAIVFWGSTWFLVDVASPILLQLPYHRCPYDLIPQIPETIVTAAWFIAGSFCLGWAGLAYWLGDHSETSSSVSNMVRSLLQWSFIGYLVSLAMMTMELLVA